MQTQEKLSQQVSLSKLEIFTEKTFRVLVNPPLCDQSFLDLD